jgi:hypothetical protein
MRHSTVPENCAESLQTLSSCGGDVIHPALRIRGAETTLAQALLLICFGEGMTAMEEDRRGQGSEFPS